jgi:hypothetical protein
VANHHRRSNATWASVDGWAALVVAQM